MTDEVRVVAIIKALPGKGETLLAHWPELAAKVHAEDGCLSYDLHQVKGKADRFVVLERWASLPALAAHGASDHMRAWAATSAELTAEPTHVLVLEDEPAA